MQGATLVGAVTAIQAIYYILRPVHNTMLNNVLCCIAFVSMFEETKHDTMIDSYPISTFPRTAFLRLVVKKSLTF